MNARMERESAKMAMIGSVGGGEPRRMKMRVQRRERGQIQQSKKTQTKDSSSSQITNGLRRSSVPSSSGIKTSDSTIEPVIAPVSRKTAPKMMMIDIGGGIRLPLRGSDETRKAIKEDFFVPLVCVACSEEIFCVLDAKCCVCPSCEQFSPLDGGDNSHGVGLGFTIETLALMQWEAINHDQNDDSSNDLPSW